MNRVCLIARLTRDPELRDAGGTPVVNLRVAYNTRRKGEDKPNFVNVTAFGKTAELVAQYCAKGREVGIDGRLEWREWEQDGNRREAVEIIADNVRFLGGKGEDGGSDAALPAASADEQFPF